MAIETTLTVSFVEMDSSPSEGYDESGRFFVQQRLRCAFADRLTLMRQLKGGFRDNDTNEMVLPYSYPWLSEARVLTVESEPWPAVIGAETTTGDSLANYSHAMLTVTYNVRDVSFQDDSDDIKLVEHRVEGGGEFLTFNPENSLWWQDADDIVQAEDAPGTLRTTIVWNLTVFDVVNPPTEIFDNIGSVNDAAMSQDHIPIAAWTVPLGTMRYDFPALDKTVTTEGNETWTVTMQFSFTPAVDAYPSGTATWNYFFRPGRTSPERIWISAADRGDGSKWNIYPLQDLNAMITNVKNG